MMPAYKLSLWLAVAATIASIGLYARAAATVPPEPASQGAYVQDAGMVPETTVPAMYLQDAGSTRLVQP